MREWIEAVKTAFWMFINVYCDEWERTKPLPIIRIGKTRYFVDERARQIRNVKDPDDCWDLVPVRKD
jgi:hypothetical protein